MIIREMRLEELPIIAEIYRDTFRATHQGVVTDSFIESVTYESALARFDRIFHSSKCQAFCYVVEISNKIIGFAIGSIEIDSSKEYPGELKMLYILPVFQRMGIGRALVHEIAKHLEANNIQSMFVGLFKNNILAEKFYKSLGAVRLQEYFGIINEENFALVNYGWPSIHELTKA